MQHGSGTNGSNEGHDILSEAQFISFDPILNVDDWNRAEEPPTGTREKLTLIEPETERHYIFKYPKKQRQHQLWSELLASFIGGDLLGWDIQTTGIAIRGGRPGNLLQYVYEPGTDDAAQEVFTEGWKLCTQIDPNFDQGKGTHHTLPLLIKVYQQELSGSFHNIRREDFFDFWARALAFDALISNTDRHAENWAIIRGEGETRMAPLYDNGSSLGCGIDAVGLKRAFDDKNCIRDTHLTQQRNNGRHHLRSTEPAKHGGLFIDVCKEFLAVYPAGRCWFEAAKALDVSAVHNIMDIIAGNAMINNTIDKDYVLSQERRQHIGAMLQIGVDRMKSVIC